MMKSLTVKYPLQTFIFKGMLAALGVLLYVLHGSSLLKAILIYIVFKFIAFLANVGYHRWTAHNAVDVTLFGKFVLYFSMVSTGIIKPMTWAVVHRTHHKYADTDRDPHAPTIGFWNLIIGNYDTSQDRRSVPVLDLYRRKDLVFVDKYYYHLYVLTLVIYALIDIDVFFLSFLSLLFSFHIKQNWFNYIAHGGSKGGGPRNYFSPGFMGESLHKNHHDDPRRGNYGKVSLLNFDYGYYVLRGLFLIKGEKNG